MRRCLAVELRHFDHHKPESHKQYIRDSITCCEACGRPGAVPTPLRSNSLLTFSQCGQLARGKTDANAGVFYVCLSVKPARPPPRIPSHRKLRIEVAQPSLNPSLGVPYFQA